jgi:hypothetical protein
MNDRLANILHAAVTVEGGTAVCQFSPSPEEAASARDAANLHPS